jgi:hypothetical protein
LASSPRGRVPSGRGEPASVSARDPQRPRLPEASARIGPWADHRLRVLFRAPSQAIWQRCGRPRIHADLRDQDALVIPDTAWYSNAHNATLRENMASEPKLVAPHQYRTEPNGVWSSSLPETLSSTAALTVDTASLLSIVGRGYTFGNRTLFREVRRLPWMARAEPNGEITPRPIPPHGRLRGSPDDIADRLFYALLDEMRGLVAGSPEVVLLLSGGLDSRIAAVVMAELVQRGEISSRVRCATWGTACCRDVEYARLTAHTLNLEWEHLPLTAEHLWDNIHAAARELGASIYPTHLHRMPWCSTLPSECLVLAGSYGDSIGRGEFSGLHLLELHHLTAEDRFGLLNRTCLAGAEGDLRHELDGFHQGKTGLPSYVLREHEMLGIYMRNGLSDATNLIARHHPFGQLFTDPSVYGLMWSIHPALRTDAPYCRLLQRHGGALAVLPWARTNQAVAGPTRYAREDLRRDFHQYRSWTATVLASRLRVLVDPDWFAETGVFDPLAIRALRAETLRSDRGLLRPVELLTWLASLRLCVDGLRGRGNAVEFETPRRARSVPAKRLRFRRMCDRVLRGVCERLPIVEACAKRARGIVRQRRRLLLYRRALVLYPPVDGLRQ